MAHELTKPSAAGTPPSSAHGRVYSEFCKFMCHKLSESNKNYMHGVFSIMVFVLWDSSGIEGDLGLILKRIISEKE